VPRKSVASRAPVRVPLAVPSSRTVATCYAAHGKGRHHCAWVGARIELVLVNAARAMRVVDGLQIGSWRAASAAVATGDGWRILGWRMANGLELFGEYDRVDPELADFARLQEPCMLTGSSLEALATTTADGLDRHSPTIKLDQCTVR
jgi:hypothetical protein